WRGDAMRNDATAGVLTPRAEVPDRLGWVDGAGIVGQNRFDVLVAGHALVAVDDLVTTTQTLPDGSWLTHYGIVNGATGPLEGASLASDTRRIVAERTMPGEVVRRVQVAVLRVNPERWIAPNPGAEVFRASGVARERALFVEHMDRPLPFGLDAMDLP